MSDARTVMDVSIEALNKQLAETTRQIGAKLSDIHGIEFNVQPNRITSMDKFEYPVITVVTNQTHEGGFEIKKTIQVTFRLKTYILIHMIQVCVSIGEDEGKLQEVYEYEFLEKPHTYNSTEPRSNINFPMPDIPIQMSMGYFSSKQTLVLLSGSFENPLLKYRNPSIFWF